MPKTSIVSDRHLVLISFFGAVSIIAQIWSYAVEVDISKSLFQKYSSIFFEESKTFEWALQASSHFSLIELIIFAIITGVVLYLVLRFLNAFFKKKWDGRQPIANLIIIFAYLGLFCIFDFIHDPISLERPLNWVWGVAFAFVSGASVHLLLIHDRLRKKRIIDTSKFGEAPHKWNFLGKTFETELSEYQTALSGLLAISATLIIGLAVTSILQIIFNLPTGISFSNEFSSFMVTIILRLLILSLGLVIGVIYQLVIEIHDIRDRIRSIVE